MKKIILAIISLSFIFSSLSNTFASEWYIENLLDLNYWVEEYTLNLNELDYIHFSNEKYNIMYRNLKDVNTGLKSGFMEQYRNWEYEYYQMNWIVTNYNNFIYHTNKYFLYLRIKELNNNFWEVDYAIINSYRNMRSSYTNMKNIVRWY
jgi:hypothetical protein